MLSTEMVHLISLARKLILADDEALQPGFL